MGIVNIQHQPCLYPNSSLSAVTFGVTLLRSFNKSVQKQEGGAGGIYRQHRKIPRKKKKQYMSVRTFIHLYTILTVSNIKPPVPLHPLLLHSHQPWGGGGRENKHSTVRNAPVPRLVPTSDTTAPKHRFIAHERSEGEKRRKTTIMTGKRRCRGRHSQPILRPDPTSEPSNKTNQNPKPTRSWVPRRQEGAAVRSCIASEKGSERTSERASTRASTRASKQAPATSDRRTTNAKWKKKGKKKT